MICAVAIPVAFWLPLGAASKGRSSTIRLQAVARELIMQLVFFSRHPTTTLWRQQHRRLPVRARHGARRVRFGFLRGGLLLIEYPGGLPYFH